MVRKQKARADKEQTAAENRALHGRTKADKQRDRVEAERAAGHIEGHKRTTQKLTSRDEP